MRPEEFHQHDLDYSPWSFWTDADQDAQARQLDLQHQFEDADGHQFGTGCFVSGLASVQNEKLQLGDRTYIAAGAYLTGDLQAGADCSINAYTVVRGSVRMGDGVRIGAHTSILGFNHSMADPDLPVFRQPLTAKGITIGSDVWIGSHVVILDGVNVGDHSVLAAGAIVTKDVPSGAVVGGNPARLLRWRVPAAASADELSSKVQVFAEQARATIPGLLERTWNADRRLFADRPGAAPTVRAQCDAIELADLLLGRAPDQLPAAEQIERLRGWQDPVSGLVAEIGDAGEQLPIGEGLSDGEALYHVLSVGYALDLLGSSFAEPIHAVAQTSADDLLLALNGLPWRDQAWGGGAWIDAIGTAHLWNGSQPDALLGWMLTHASPETGMWGSRTPQEGLLQVVNGFYRATRGTFAQFGLPVPYPERVIDTVLQHAQDVRHFAPDRYNACNVLDVAHPLWLTRQTGYRAEEVVTLARKLLTGVLKHWIDGSGFAFAAPNAGSRPGQTTPGLQGTEMWLATAWLLADLAGVSGALGYRPRGVHRPEAAVTARAWPW